MDCDPPYGVTTPPPERDLACLEGAEIPWWADLIDADELADVIRNQCDEKVGRLRLISPLVNSNGLTTKLTDPVLY